MIAFLTINIFYYVKSNILFDLFYYQYSKITLKIKGIGEHFIFGNDAYSKFESIYYPNEIYINGNKESKINYKYYFNQTENFVELIWNESINNCKNMFYKCSNITEINLFNFETLHVTSMFSMFYNCFLLTSLNLSNFDTSLVTSMESMFYGCSLLTSLDLSKFDTSKVSDMNNMFYNCLSLRSLNLSNFNTSAVENMDYMFYYCSSMILLHISNFDTSQVSDMNSMFYNCSSLTSLDLSNFDTSQVTDMNSMFYNCSSLTSLNLSIFNTSLVTFMSDMFNGCIILEYINLNNFDEKNLMDKEKYYNNMFNNIPDNIIICINESNTKSKIFPQLKNIINYTIDCSDNLESKQTIIFSNINKYIKSYDIFSQYQLEYNNSTNEFLFDDNNLTNKYKCELNGCLICANASFNKIQCIECNINYYPKENDPSNIDDYLNCFKDPEGYYLDINLYKRCFYKCKTCNISGNNITHNCIECNDNYPFEIKIKNNNYVNCYNCSYYYYFDDENNYHCTIDSSCPKEYPKLKKDNNECIKYNIEIIKEELLIYENNKEKIMTKEEERKYYDNLIDITEKIFTEDYNTSKLENGQDEVIKTEKMTIRFTTTKNQRNDINSNMSIIDLGKCEELLRIEYNISLNETLFIKKMDI